MTYKRIIFFSIFTTIFFMFIIGLINFVIDPFQQYRKAIFHKTMYMKAFYLNSGLIKSYKYDSIVIGSSMTQNFIIGEVNEFLDYNSTIKLPIAGGDIIEHYTVLKSSIQRGKLKNVLFGLDIFSLKKSKNRLPIYLYDYNVLNDYLYLINMDTLKRSLVYPFLHYTIPKTHVRLNQNLMFQWQHSFTKNDFNATKVLQGFMKASDSINLNTEAHQKISLNERIESFNQFLVPLIANNPNIFYTIFYPPYSILAYKKIEQANGLKDFIAMKRYIFNTLHQYQNVKIFDFQVAKKITFDLNNYKDITHYHQRINTWMLKQINQNLFLVDENNIEQYLRSFEMQTKHYNYN